MHRVKGVKDQTDLFTLCVAIISTTPILSKLKFQALYTASTNCLKQIQFFNRSDLVLPCPHIFDCKEIVEEQFKLCMLNLELDESQLNREARSIKHIAIPFGRFLRVLGRSWPRK